MTDHMQGMFVGLSDACKQRLAWVLDDASIDAYGCADVTRNEVRDDYEEIAFVLARFADCVRESMSVEIT